MNEQTQPTDAELLAEYDCVFNTTRTIDRHGVALRAVLAKWGTPAGAGEPFCWHWENTFNGGMGAWKKNPETLGINMSHPDYKWTALYTAPQPTQSQAGAVPLTEQQMDAIWEECKFDNGDEWSIHWTSAVRAAERLHGIKGGQHGPNT